MMGRLICVDCGCDFSGPGGTCCCKEGEEGIKELEAKLEKAEAESAEKSKTIRAYWDETQKLKAEVEKLQGLGDNLVKFWNRMKTDIGDDYLFTEEDMDRTVREWKAQKEGS